MGNGELIVSFYYRVFVQDKVFEAFVKKVKERMEAQLVLGDGMKANVNQGPLINENQFKKVCSLVEDAKVKGAQVVMGGQPATSNGPLFYNPTILTNVNSSMELFKDEIFGPVVSFIRFKDEKVSQFIHRLS